MVKKKAENRTKKTVAKSKKGNAKSKKKKSTAKSKNGIFSFTNVLVLVIVILIFFIGYKFLIVDKYSKVATITKSSKEKVSVKRNKKKKVVSAEKIAKSKQSSPKMEVETRVEISGEKAYLQGISEYAQKYIGLPLVLGKDPDRDGATDNSHLICSIIKNAAELAGMEFRGYMPMEELLMNTHEIHLSDLKNGDLIVLNNGHAALLYGFDEKQDGFYYIYASAKKGKVVKIDSANLKAYWFKNKKGYFRLNSDMLSNKEAK